MPLSILATGTDLDNVRAICMSMVPADRARTLVPDTTISLPSIGGRAEMLTIQAIGSDWQAILAGNAPVGYANGDPVRAQSLLKDVATMYCCAQLCPLLRQIIPTAEKDEIIGVTRDLDWTALQAEYMSQAGDALSMLQGSSTVPALMGAGLGRRYWP